MSESKTEELIGVLYFILASQSTGIFQSGAYLAGFISIGFSVYFLIRDAKKK